MAARTFYRPLGRLLTALSVVAAAASPAQAATLGFSALVSGQAAIVEVLDPVVPIVRAQTQASGASSLGLLQYISTDVLNMATGQGAGSNVFRALNGDELWGDFTVQLVPGQDPGQFSLFGEVIFSGGTGLFDGAIGSADFSGNANFFSANEAYAEFRFEGQLQTLPEPGSVGLAGAGLLLVGWRRLRRGLAASTHRV